MTATDLYIKKDGTISIADGDSTVTGTGTTWGGIDRQGSLLISGGVIVGVVAALDDGEEYDDLSLPLVDSYDGTDLSGADYVLLPPPSIFKGATQAAIYAYFNTFFRQNAGLFFKKSDITDWSIVPNNSLILDQASKTLYVWRDGVLDPVYATGAPFSPAGQWDGGTGTALSIATGQTAVNFASDANRFTLTVNADTEIQLPTNVTVGDQRDILFTGDGTHAVTWATGFIGTDVVRSASGARTRMRLTVTAASGGTATAVSYAMVAFDENQWVSDGGDFWVSTVDGNTSEPGTNTDWAEMPTSAGPAGEDGVPGTNGVPLIWDTGTADANPGSGKIRANNASLALATKLFIAKASAAGSDIAAWLAAADDSTNPTIKATVILTRWSDGKQTIATLSAITDATGYVKADIAYVSGQTAFTAADDLGLNIERVGNKGTDGNDGAPGADGTDGSDGAPGADGSDGADGTDPGILFTWDDGNSDADPGSGKLRADNDDLSAATKLYVSKNNRAGDDIGAFLAGIDDSTNPTVKAKIVLTRSGGNAQATFDLASVTDASGYVKLAISNFAGATGFLLSDAISLQAYPVGNAGANGAGAGTVTNAVAIGANEIVIGDDGVDGVKGSGKTHSTDGTLASNSDAKVPTEKAVKTYVDANGANATSVASVIHGATGKSTPVDADELALIDSAASNVLKKLTWANLKATLKTYLDTLYQPLAAILTAIAALSSTGLIARTGSGTVAVRTLTAPAAGITVSNGDGVSGNPTLALANDLSALEGLSSTGLAARTATDTWAQRTVTAGAGISVTNGNGVSGNPTVAADVGKQSIWIPAGAMIPFVTNGAASGLVELSTNKWPLSTLDFDTTTQEFAGFAIRMPKSWNESTVTFIPVWSHASTATNFGVVWGLDGAAISDDDAGDASFGTAQTSADTGGTTNDIYQGPESSAITIAGTPAAGDLVQFRLHRDPANASDTMAIDARLLGILLLYTIDTLKDD